jgi:uncharacterized protein YndB with AHSA1/START domain
MSQRRGGSVIEQSRILPSSPLTAYRAIADPREHSAFTGAPATGRARPGTAFTAWGGYIRGRTLVAVPGRRLVQEWSTSEWPEGTAPSRLEWRFRPHPRGTRVTMRQTGVPRSQVAAYRKGWVLHYWRPLRAYCAARG